MYRRPDGIVDFHKEICIGCKACIAACPYGAIFINPEDHSAEKCNFCAHRLEVGLEPACVVVCPTEAILIGNLEDPESRVAKFVNRDVVAVRRPEKETLPKLFYTLTTVSFYALQDILNRGAHQATLDPLAAERPTATLPLPMVRLRRRSFSGHPGPASNIAGNWLVERGGLRFDEASVTWRIDFDRCRAAIRDLAKEVMAMERTGDAERAEVLFARYGSPTPAIEKSGAAIDALPRVKV